MDNAFDTGVFGVYVILAIEMSIQLGEETPFEWNKTIVDFTCL